MLPHRVRDPFCCKRASYAPFSGYRAAAFGVFVGQAYWRLFPPATPGRSGPSPADCPTDDRVDLQDAFPTGRGHSVSVAFYLCGRCKIFTIWLNHDCAGLSLFKKCFPWGHPSLAAARFSALHRKGPRIARRPPPRKKPSRIQRRERRVHPLDAAAGCVFQLRVSGCHAGSDAHRGRLSKPKLYCIISVAKEEIHYDPSQPAYWKHGWTLWIELDGPRVTPRTELWITYAAQAGYGAGFARESGLFAR